jgi:3-oxoacyl-(acyl-carrier-protein) synthase
MDTDMGRERVVITGMGVVTSIGRTLDEFWRNCLAGTSGIARITGFDPSNFSTQIAVSIRMTLSTGSKPESWTGSFSLESWPPMPL